MLTSGGESWYATAGDVKAAGQEQTWKFITSTIAHIRAKTEKKT
jgi:hypothetical protein